MKNGEEVPVMEFDTLAVGYGYPVPHGSGWRCPEPTGREVLVVQVRN